MSHYRLAEVNGRSVFVGPDERAFFMRGIYALEWDASQSAVFRKRHGNDDKWHQRWAAHVTAQARAWGFNVASEYSAWDYHPPTWFFSDPEQQMPYVHQLPVGSYILEARGGEVPDLIANADSDYNNWRGGSLPDVFHPAFESEVNRFFDEKRDDWIKNADPKSDRLLGLTLDDADRLFGFGPGPDFPSPRVHPHIAEIVRANKESYALRVLKDIGHDDEFLATFAERFFKVTTGAVRSRYPGVLVFGPAALNQHGGVSRPEVLREVASYCDVVQVAITSPAAYLETVKATGSTPLVVWETVVANPDSSIGGQNPRETPQWPWIASTQEERGKVYAQRARMMYSLPQIAGVSWWSWHDHPAERMNFGLVNIREEPYEEFVNAVASVHEELDGVPLPPPPPERPPDLPPVETRGEEYDVEGEFGTVKFKGRVRLKRRAG